MEITRFIPKKLLFRFIPSLLLALCMIVSLFVASPANAEIPTPRLKPPAPNASQFLSDKDAERFRKGVRAARRGHWSELKNITRSLNDPVATETLRWIHASRNSRASFEDLSHVVQNLSNWPRMTSIQSKAENMLFDNPLSAQRTIAWFGGKEPVSGEGRAALARAYYQLGDQVSGDQWLRLAWRESKLTRKRQQEIFKHYRNKLTKADHAARADHLIWLGRTHHSKAEALLPHMDLANRRLMNARIRTASNRSGMDAAIKAVPSQLKNDPGLLYERAKWRRKKKTKEYALPVYTQIQTAPLTEDGKKALWREKRIMIYWAIEKKKYADAYKMTLNHGMTRGEGFAAAEFLAGWLALTKLGQPGKAAQHFQTLKNGVTTPVSLSRGAYWQARAAERLGDGNARAYYAEAASYPNTYYGQLAADQANGRLSQVFLPPEADTSDLEPSFESDPRIRAMHLLGEVRDERFFSTFAFHLDDVLSDQRQLSLLSKLSREYGYMRPSVRAAKQAGRFQTMLTDSGYPIVVEIESLPAQFDKPFVYAIARQESEFEGNVVSSAKAYGMMQMINSTAKATARKHRIPYSVARLTADNDYSAKLGAHHLHDLLNQFDGSYILAATSYNAGPHRSKQWIQKYGDPRSSSVDAIDWIESIPFSETRNYVQRVLENMQVYRARRNGNSHENLIYKDINDGAF